MLDGLIVVQLTIALAQLNPTVGDIDGNLARIRRARDGRPPAAPISSCCPSSPSSAIPRKISCCARRSSMRATRPSTAWCAKATTRPRSSPRRPGARTAACTTPRSSSTRARRRGGSSRDLPNYGVFDEKRVFAPGPMPDPVNFRGITIGVPVCEDIWTPAITAHLARARRGVLPRAERLAVRSGKVSDAARAGARARARDESRTGVRQPDRRTGRARVRRAIVRRRSLGRARVLDGRAGKKRSRSRDGRAPATAGCVSRARRAAGRTTRRHLQRAHRPACATTWRRTDFLASCWDCQAASTRR